MTPPQRYFLDVENVEMLQQEIGREIAGKRLLEVHVNEIHGAVAIRCDLIAGQLGVKRECGLG
jgi:hypothetical protein